MAKYAKWFAIVSVSFLILIIVLVVVGGGEEKKQSGPRLATVQLTGAMKGVGLSPVMKRVNRACQFPGEVIKGPDGDYFSLKHGDRVEILEQDSDCIAPKGGASKVFALETGLVGWLNTSFLREK